MNRDENRNSPTASENSEIISVLFTRNHRWLPIELYFRITGRGYTHASLSVDGTLKNFYSFTYLGFREEHPEHRKCSGKMGSLCLQFRVTRGEYQQLCKRLTVLQKTGCDFNWVGYLLAMLHIKLPIKIGNGYFCSEFVASELSLMDSFDLPRVSWAYKPTQLAVDLQSQPNLQQVIIDKL